ncbi:50S ribosomal protein L5 [Candidatus Roizmanbacteria bacterium RIFCSPHIGHO2_02_FULL_40_13b]|uniref:Large ribosomal subunit protein uL5 n=1 Tax=Candidatus Roizmanbacteria bacterium RIFCSPHIGHO2_01_FULL_39_24 TaxID=1802032 RepID=A0A1F7GLL4_9BACT|nr:MAG: 50S ribosomal protein L5 [Candidatus Roizmanbacteria bacterium RIFCSPHIGHO2_01_FULL_39_24]OGK27813.1 MAG: 50S ribosomal protein L5 [Candidatus Roizmanbacteria bacterium RIFCSPHIGHO2_02_FULL_40_13b]OGK49955.1 MAG: 50S ribosomal protein L5 [Candidatus Roizmanbacteria bacterium RIFCSPLOWO2_01_FULL_40_32]OGK55960.1 MAG: 50S ribosomal protein L5 [Candidatus Roizmanbacteria bacterium RIFCSPLOWO2_02_FULL_39_8]
MLFKEYYQKEVAPVLKKDLKLENMFEVPKMKKVVINVGVGEAATDKKVLDRVVEDLSIISGQKAVITKARKSVSAFKIRKGLPIGAKVTLRGDRMYFFIEKLIKIVLPRIRDFRGISPRGADGRGNFNLGMTDQTLFPEIEYDKIDRIRGLQITIVTSAKNNSDLIALLTLLGFPFEEVKT